jgi:hypothetical protein
MKIRKAILWSLLNSTDAIDWHPSITAEEKKISGSMPILAALFPGINYYSITGFSAAMRDCAIPALKKMHPELIGVPANAIATDDTVEIEELLPSNGYEWQDSTAWQSTFQQLLAA